MKPLFALAALVGAVGFVSGADSAAPRPRANAHARFSRTVWDSVYSDSQARRGDTLYRQTCANCHGPALAGGDSGAPLVGKPFISNWNGLALSDLADRIRTSMPPDNPRSVPRPVITDILAFILSQNKFPSGAKALPTDVEGLKEITIAETRP